MHLPISVILAGSALLLGGTRFAVATENCEGLKDLMLDHATVVSARWVEPAPLKQATGMPFKLPEITIPRHCEVSGVARPTSDSEIGFSLWLPPQDVWNGKYLQKGNGGWAGSIQPLTLAGPLLRRYAVAATDDGHRTEGLMPDASWATGHPEKLIDFGYRSLHETARLSKSILDAFYGKPAAHAFFSGCSDGGREALMEAERYPEDFEGILAGAPANQWTHHFAGFVWNELALGAKPESRISSEQLPAIQKAALAACDALDGVKDGLIEDPRSCHFDPSVLLCHGAPGPECLTQPQIDALAKIYAGPVNPRTHEQIYPGYEPGTEADPAAWGAWIVGPIQSAFGNTFFSQVVYEDPGWKWQTTDLDRDTRLADEKTASILNSYNPDLRSFRDHGGKLIQYHGWGDAAIAPRDSIAFYEKVQAFLKRYPDPRSKNPADTHGFYRLFMVPGLQHCAGGPGPTNFGNLDFMVGNAVPEDADHDIYLALERWVIDGVAPQKIIGTGQVGADARNSSPGVRLTRPLCAYPAVARYKGHGDTNSADNFDCVQEPER
jgi:feruloyl esterase